MSTLLLLFSAINLSSGAPAIANHTGHASAIVVFGRQLPDCANVARYRTIQEIVLSCLATIFACTWVAVHPNLPGPWDSGRTKLKRRVLMMVYATLAPEVMTMWAFRQWTGAQRIAKELNEADGIVVEEQSSWQVVKNLIKDAVDEWLHGPYRNPPKTWTATHGFFIQMGGFHLCEGRTPKRVLDVYDLKELIRKGEMPDIAEEDINDKSKGDFLTKLLVVLQTTWFVFQCIARWASDLAVTELEVVTLAFAVLNVITYGLWWKKPQGVVDGPLRVSMFSADHRTTSVINKKQLPLMAVSALFGALHLIPWSSSFPSTAEKWLWRSSSLFITIQPLILVLSGIVYGNNKGNISETLSSILAIPSALLGLPLYILARLILLCLAFATLRHLPPDAYANIEWTTFVPHL